MKKPVKYFQIIESKDIREISKEEIEFEEGIKALYEEL
jgi:hypothetical protein